jgi:segregation and condensation protein B
MNKLALLEAALFITEKPLKLDELAKLLKTTEDEVKKLLDELDARYKNNECGIEIAKLNGFRLTVKPEYTQRVARFTKHAELSRGLLRALSIIAHYEPMKQSDLVRAIGNRAYEYIRELVSLGFIVTEKYSRTKILRTTRHFEEYFGIKKAKELRESGLLDDSKSKK